MAEPMKPDVIKFLVWREWRRLRNFSTKPPYAKDVAFNVGCHPVTARGYMNLLKSCVDVEKEYKIFMENEREDRENRDVFDRQQDVVTFMNRGLR